MPPPSPSWSWTTLTRYVEDDTITIDSNSVERAMRPVTLGWKKRLFAESGTGGRRAGTIYSLVATAKLDGLDPEACLRHVPGCIAYHPVNRVAELLSWNIGTNLVPHHSSLTNFNKPTLWSRPDAYVLEAARPATMKQQGRWFWSAAQAKRQPALSLKRHSTLAYDQLTTRNQTTLSYEGGVGHHAVGRNDGGGVVGPELSLDYPVSAAPSPLPDYATDHAKFCRPTLTPNTISI